MKLLMLLFLLCPISMSAQADLTKIFQEYNVNGSITIYDLKKDNWIFSDKYDSEAGTLPASTFKIINSLIAIELGILSDEKEIIKFVGINNVDTIFYGNRPDIFKDMNLAEAFEKSAVWFHLELAKKIGREKYLNYLKQCNYGNLDFSEKGVDFWNFGAFRITPIQQINFLKNLYKEKLPFSKRTIEIVKKIMITETGDNYIIRAKTGMGIQSENSIGWWVGYLEKKENIYIFATRLKTNSTNYDSEFAQKRKTLTKSVLKELTILE